MVSATSTGFPPCESEFEREKTTRCTYGIAAVMSVSIKPGPTALIVIPRAVSTGASARTSPTIAAFVSA